MLKLRVQFCSRFYCVTQHLKAKFSNFDKMNKKLIIRVQRLFICIIYKKQLFIIKILYTKKKNKIKTVR